MSSCLDRIFSLKTDPKQPDAIFARDTLGIGKDLLWKYRLYAKAGRSDFVPSWPILERISAKSGKSVEWLRKGDEKSGARDTLTVSGSNEA